MRFDFKLPDIGEGTAEAEIGAWHVAPGDYVQEDQLLVDVMTDKATVEMTSPVTGRITSIHGEAGQMVPVGSLLVVFLVEGEGDDTIPSDRSRPDASKAVRPSIDLPSPAVAALAVAKLPEALDAAAALSSTVSQLSHSVARQIASPAVRKAAFSRGVHLQFVTGTGPNGRITLADLDRPITSPGSPALVRRPEEVTEKKVIGLRRRIAEKMQESKRQIPHFGYVEEFDLTELEALRGELNATRSPREPKLTILPFFIRAVVDALREFPVVNSRFEDAQGILRTYGSVHIGIATQTPSGLMVPVIRNAERLNLWESADQLARVTQAARAGNASKEELSNSTITLTSLGMLGGIAATPIINYPEVAIIGPNKLMDRPVVRDGQIVVGKVMNVSSSFDHRIVDGHDAAQFIQAIKRLIERPSLLFLERIK